MDNALNFKVGSLFDGSGGFPLAGLMCGGTPIWASEVEPYPIAVTKSRFPKMKHLGDISKINGADVEPVDVISFGSPCQDLSVAGKRAGLKHENNGDEETTRSGLFMEAVRIIKEMRRATNGKYPRFALWENVPGAFSSNKGEDFRIVLEELIKITEPTAVMPSVPQKGWSYADCFRGDGWSLAYRVLDAQFWGVPQRRRRIYLVADFGGWCAEEILFEREGLRGYFTESRPSREEIAGYAKNSVGTTDSKGECVAFSFDSLSSNSMKSSNPHSGCRQVAVSKCLDTTDPNPSKNQGGIAILEPIPYTLKIRSGCEGGGKGWKEDVCYTPNTIDRPAVAFAMQGFGDYKDCGVASGLKGRDYKDSTDLVVEEHPIALDRAFYNQGQNALYDPQYYEDGTCPTLVAKDPAAVCVQYIVRRLTPLECNRLQGFPDYWGKIDHKEDFTDEEYTFWLEVRNTHAEINGKTVKDYTKQQMLTWYNKLHTDSAEYKMWGNGIALPNALYCMQGISDVFLGNIEKPKRTRIDRVFEVMKNNLETRKDSVPGQLNIFDYPEFLPETDEWGMIWKD